MYPHAGTRSISLPVMHCSIPALSKEWHQEADRLNIPKTNSYPSCAQLRAELFVAAVDLGAQCQIMSEVAAADQTASWP